MIVIPNILNRDIAYTIINPNTPMLDKYNTFFVAI